MVSYLDEIVEANPVRPVSSAELNAFCFEGSRIRLVVQSGIWKPAGLTAALTIRTAYTPPDRLPPYADALGEDWILRYKYRGTDPMHSDNRALREAMRSGSCLAYFIGIAPGVYFPLYPVWVVDEVVDRHEFAIAADEGQRFVDLHDLGMPQRAYVEQCAICRLRHSELLDAAHIIPDGQLNGDAIVPNGLALCKIHHAAYDRDLIGVRPDLVVEVAPRVLEEVDGPMLRHGLQEMAGRRLFVPRQRAERGWWAEVSTDWVGRVTSLNQWKRGGVRAPHKPLLLLYALGRLQQTGSSQVAYTEAEEPLQHLLVEFGPPRRTSPGYPFHHLVSDGLWVVRTPRGGGSPGSNRTQLRAGAVGELAPDFARALRDPQVFDSVVQGLLAANFPVSLQPDILEAVGISLAPTGVTRTTGARRRDPAFRERVLIAYEYQCAVCGYDGQLGGEAVGIDAAHIRWWAAAGPDEVANGISLCSLHHKLFDRGAIGLTSERTIMVSGHFLGRGSAASAAVLSLIDRPVRRPQPGHAHPDLAYVRWHCCQVFRKPARQAG